MKGQLRESTRLIVGDLDQGATFNGLPILVAEQLDFEHNGTTKAKRHLDSFLVQDPETVNPGMDVEFPESVKLLINRQHHYINIGVTCHIQRAARTAFLEISTVMAMTTD